MRASRARASFLTLLLAVTAAPLRAEEIAEPAPLSMFMRTAIALRDDNPEQQALFVREALGELYTVYSAEAELARRQIELSQSPGKLRSWSGAVDRYAEQVLLLLEDLEQGFPVQISTRRDAVVVVAVADRWMMLTHPRVGQQQPYEAQVLDVFCRQVDCAALARVEIEPEEEPVYYGQVRPEWRFSDGGASCHHDGSALQFRPAQGLPRLRLLCRAWFEEVQDLQRELAWQQVLDVEVEWGALAIRATPGGTQHFIVLNGSGDTVLSELPLLYDNAAVLPQLGQWLSRRQAGAEPPELALDGNSLSFDPR